MSFDLSSYETVQTRLERFWADHPEGRIVTDMLTAPEGQFIVKAMVWRGNTDSSGDDWDYSPSATGLAHEVVGQGNVNRTSALENCETSAIGRALANLGYSPKGGERASREEMEKATAEPAPVSWKAWVWEESAIFKAWSDDERKQAALSAMERVLDGADDIANQAEAKAVLDEMHLAYDARQSQEKLNV